MPPRFDWPPITEQKLLERLALDDEGFSAFTEKIAALVPKHDFDEAAFAHALEYPWGRPAESYLLTGTQTTLLSELTSVQREALAEGRSIDGSESPSRFPLLSFGSNAAPPRLASKLEALSADHHEAAVIRGELHGFDVGASAHPAFYGALPATIFASPGTAVRAAVQWVTLEQLTALTWTEMSYFLGRLDDIEFVPDFESRPIESVLLFVSRLGAQSVDGEIVAMAAIEARGRTAPELSQLELLTAVALKALGADAGARDVVRRIFDDFANTAREIREALRPDAVPFASDHWTRFGD